MSTMHAKDRVDRAVFHFLALFLVMDIANFNCKYHRPRRTSARVFILYTVRVPINDTSEATWIGSWLLLSKHTFERILRQ
jgi:hypothetical protein